MLIAQLSQTRPMYKHKIKGRNHRIEEHLHIVHPIAIKYSLCTGQDREDLTQVGMLGLIRAAQNFQCNSDVPFSAFARPHIRGAILHYLRDSVGIVKIPRRIDERAQKLLRNANAYSAGVLDESKDLTAEDRLAIEIYKQKGRWQFLDDELTAPEMGQWDEIVNKERIEILMNALSKLKKQQYIVINHVVIKGESLRTTAKLLGVSAMTVQRRAKKALRELAINCAEIAL